MNEAAISRILSRQHGLITRAQANMFECGNRGVIQHRLDIGRWVGVGPGVYRLAGVRVTWRQRALAACLSAGPGAVVSHRSAAVLFGVSGFRPGPIDITVPPGSNGRNRLATVHRSVVLPAERASKDGIPLTRPSDLADLARTVSPDLVEEAVDDVLCRRLASLDRLWAAPATSVLRRVLEAWEGDGEPASVAEMRLVRDLLAAGLPQPVRQYYLADAAAHIDLAYPDERVAIELDSFRWHAGRRPFGSDRARGNRIVAAGWRLLRAVPGDSAPLISAAAHLVRRVA